MRAFFAFLFCSTVLFGQENLICNESFESVNNDVQNKLENGDAVYSLHFSQNSNESIFPCWQYVPHREHDGGSLTNSAGGVFGIIPGFFQSNSGNQNLSFSTFEVYQSVSGADKRVLSANGNSTGLRLQNSGNESGFYFSPPNSKFTSDLTTPYGLNFLALFDAVSPLIGLVPSIGTELKTPLIKDRYYSFEINYALMNMLDEFINAEGFSSIKQSRLKVYLCNGNFGDRQEILNTIVDSQSWETHLVPSIKAHSAHTHLLITLDVMGPGGATRVAGCVIDNLKLYEKCEDLTNQCDNSNYRGDLSDVKLEVTEIGDPLAYQNENQNSNDYLQTIKATHLDNVRRLEMRIMTPNGTVVKTIDHWYPYSEYVWDGRDDGGYPLPEGIYKAVINAVSNDCFHNSYPEQKNFHLKRKYKVFANVGITSEVLPTVNSGFVTVPRISGLEQVKWLNVKIYNSGGQLVFDNSYSNPASEFVLSTSFGDPANNPELATGLYKVILQMSNNCQNSSLGNNWDYYFEEWTNIGTYSNYNVADPSVFYWSSVPKGNFECPFEIEYPNNYLAPRDCCEGDLYLDNVSINTSWTVNIQHDIVIGDNVVFEPGTSNTLYAGHEIYIVSGAQGVDIENAVQFYPSYNCPICIATGNSTVNALEDEYSLFLEEDLGRGNFYYYLHPNPLTQESEFIVQSMNSEELGEVKSIELFSLNGTRVDCDFTILNPKEIKVFPKRRLSPGTYFVKVVSAIHSETLRLIVR